MDKFEKVAEFAQLDRSSMTEYIKEFIDTYGPINSLTVFYYNTGYKETVDIYKEGDDIYVRNIATPSDPDDIILYSTDELYDIIMSIEHNLIPRLAEEFNK